MKTFKQYAAMKENLDVQTDPNSVEEIISQVTQEVVQQLNLEIQQKVQHVVAELKPKIVWLQKTLERENQPEEMKKQLFQYIAQSLRAAIR